MSKEQPNYREAKIKEILEVMYPDKAHNTERERNKRILENTDIGDYYMTASDESTSLKFKRELLHIFLDIENKLLLDKEKEIFEQKRPTESTNKQKEDSEALSSWDFEKENNPWDEQEVYPSKPNTNFDIQSTPSLAESSVSDSEQSQENQQTDTSSSEEEIPLAKPRGLLSIPKRIKNKIANYMFGASGLPRKILEKENPGNSDFVESELERYHERKPKMKKVVHEDIHGERAFNIDLEIPELICEPQLKNFFSRVLHQYSNFSGLALKDTYDNEPDKWVNSVANRARMVILEATTDNIEQIAKAVLEASPLERIVIAGLDEGKQAALKTSLIKQWNIKINEIKKDENGPDTKKNTSLINRLTRKNKKSGIKDDKKLNYENKLKDALQQGQNVSLDVALENADLAKLMGPHAFLQTNDISFENIKTELNDPTFSSKIDEIVLYGSDDKLATELPILTKKSGADQYLAVRSENFTATEEASEYWTVSLTSDDPIKELTSSKEPEEILFKKTKNEGGETIIEKIHTLNPAFDNFFNTRAAEKNLKEKDVSYLKDMFLSHSLYPNNLSPKLYASTITKAQSGLNGKGAVVVGDALPWAAIGRIIATALGARFAVNSTMFDTANDINQEEQEKMLTYKGMFNDLIVHYSNNSNLNTKEIYEKASEEVFDAYLEIEKSKAVIKHEEAARDYRLYSFKQANLTNTKNELGIKLIKPQPLAFLYSVITSPLGLGLAVTGTVLAAPLVLPAAGIAVFATALTLLTVSLYTQRFANAVHLAKWHRLSARARTSKKEAQDERQKLAETLSHEITAKKEQSLGTSLSVEQDIVVAPEVGKTAEMSISNSDVPDLVSIDGDESQKSTPSTTPDLDNTLIERIGSKTKIPDQNYLLPQPKRKKRQQKSNKRNSQRPSGGEEESKEIELRDGTKHRIYSNSDVPDLVSLNKSETSSLVCDGSQNEEQSSCQMNGSKTTNPLDGLKRVPKQKIKKREDKKPTFNSNRLSI